MSDNHEWAKALQPGDKVAIRVHGYFNAPYEILTFSRATATLLIFNEGDARERRARKSDLTLQRSYARIEPVTDAVRDAVARHKLIQELSGLREGDLKKLSTKYLSDMHSTLTLARAESRRAA